MILSLTDYGALTVNLGLIFSYGWRVSLVALNVRLGRMKDLLSVNLCRFSPLFLPMGIKVHTSYGDCSPYFFAIILEDERFVCNDPQVFKLLLSWNAMFVHNFFFLGGISV